MTIASSISKHTYAGNGATTQWPFTFKIFDESNIQVYLTDINGAETKLDTGYRVDKQNGYVKYPYPSGTPLPCGWKITLLRVVPLVQETDLVNQGPFLAEVIEDALDRLTAVDQQQQEQLNRTLRHAISVDEDVSLKLPAPVPLHSFRWDAEGKKLETTIDPATVIPAAEAARDAAIIAKNDAQTARTGAETARAGAEAAEDNAATSAADAASSKNAAQNAQAATESILHDVMYDVSSRIPDRSLASSKFRIGADGDRIQPENLSDAVKAMMAGTTPVVAGPADQSVTTSKYADGSFTFIKFAQDAIDGIDKRAILQNDIRRASSTVSRMQINKVTNVNNGAGSIAMSLGSYQYIDNNETNAPFTSKQVAKFVRWATAYAADWHDISATDPDGLKYFSYPNVLTSTVTTSRDITNSRMVWGAWFRKSDLLALPAGSKFDACPIIKNVNGSSVSLDASSVSLRRLIPACLTVGNIVSINTVSCGKVTFSSPCETNDWIFFQGEIERIPAGAVTFEGLFRLFLPDTSARTVDFMNYTLLILDKTLTLDPTFVYPETIEEANDNAAIRGLVLTVDATKQEKIAPMKTGNDVNAIKYRYSQNPTPVIQHLVTMPAETSLSYVYNQDIHSQYGEPNVIRLTGKGRAYNPQLTVVVTPQDLASIGVVPDDTTPPTVSFMAAWLRNTLLNQNEASMQIFFAIRYADAGTITAGYNQSTDVTFVGADTGAHMSYLGAGDAIFNHSAGTILNSSVKGFYHKGVKIPATYGGKPFQAILIHYIGYGNTTNASEAAQFDAARLAVIKGSEINPAKTYTNNPSDIFLPLIKMENLDPTLQSNINNSTQGIKTIDIKSADKIVIIGDSFSASHYAVKDKAYISNLSMLSEFNFENFSRSGDDFAEMRDRVVNNTPEYHSSIGIKDYGAKYALLLSYANEGYTIGANLDYYYEELRDLIQEVRSLGIDPIVCTEFYSNNGYDLIGLKRVADDYGCKFYDIATKAKLFHQGTPYAPFWGNGHPGTRTNGLFYDNLLKHLSTLPRPRQSLKIFRVRPGVSTTDIQALIVDTIPQRAKIWKEISVGHHALTDAQASYYDKLDGVTAQFGYFAYQNVTSEYLKLQNRESVSLGEYALVEIIAPSTARGITEFVLHLSDPSVSVYGRNLFNSPEIVASQKYQAFIYTGSPNIVAGDVYTSSHLGTTQYTVVANVSDKKVILCSGGTSATSPSTAASAGTLTKVSGSGDASIPYTKLCAGFDPDWYAKYGKPEGKWTQIAGTNGAYTIDAANVKNYCQYDKFAFLLYKSGGIALTDIYATWKGTEDKVYNSRLMVKESTGPELLVQTRLGNSSELSSWSVTGSVSPIVPADSVLPYGCTGCVEVDASNMVSQAISLPAENELIRELQIKVWGRVFPAIFDPTAGSYPTGAPVNSDTFDLGTLAIDLNFTGASYPITFEELVGLHWKEIIIQAQIPGSLTSLASGATLRFYSKDKKIQIARVSVKLAN